MSLRARIVVLFAAALVLTLAVASALGERIAAQALERSLRERTIEMTRAVAEELDLSPGADPVPAARRLAVILTQRRGVHFAQLSVRRGANVEVARVHFGPEGAEVETLPTHPASLPLEIDAALVDDSGARSWRVDLPLREGRQRPFGALRLEASLSEVEAIATTERSVFFLVAGLGASLLAVAFTLALRQMLTRPLTELASAMAAVESGPLAAVHVPALGRGDEIGTVARGLAAMLGRVRSFNDDLRRAVDDAVHDLARKNRELEEVNHLLVEARRDLGSKERLAALGQLSGTIAHELGNPLNTISGNIQLLARDPACPPATRAGLELVEREVRRMTETIRRFLDSARALTPEPEMVELASLVDEALTLSVPVDARARLAVSTEVAPDARRVRVDPALVRHVLGNLVSNAVDAMPERGELTVRARREGEAIRLEVSDTGTGMGPDERRRIFEPFYTTKPRGKGTGLGLAISREIAAALRGHIEVESAPGAGSTFRFVFPEAPEAPATPAPTPAVRGRAQG